MEDVNQFPAVERRRNPGLPSEQREKGEIAVFQELGKALTSSLQLDQVLRTIMEKIDELKEADVKTRMTDPTHLSRANRHKWEQNLIAQLPFASILENYDRVFIKDKISEIRELRNRLVHGRYLTESNEQIISIICQQIHRFLVSPGYVGNFNDRTLINLQGL